ncbi:hypothetical protein [Actinoplanes couchii]|uniref:Uncharacterized protein n=1 Tax=Actinoplanes couchii TaxID=403638 RepID=A0ABQ3XG78_9ACTN|nr:hypothetical protein [Actinoplanes couchii]MDR6320990.1 hypothetical protein [Actinoplanes couchii]GID57501.1 hypothetical protein Aco03nite_059050 [Actinoplanes couchii]
MKGRAIGWLGHPMTMAALALLVVNDHILKATFPGWVTGKLSDVAGMVLAPPLLAVLVGLIAPRLSFRRVAVGSIVAVGVGFGFVKAWSYGAQFASQVWSLGIPSLIRADVTDLLVLPFLAVAWWAARQQPRDGRRVRAFRLAVLLPVALMGVAATSAVLEPFAARVFAVDGKIHLDADGGEHVGAWSISDDQGETWTNGERLTDPPAPNSCSQTVPVVCYRPIPGALGVQSSTAGGPWTVSWQLSDRDRKNLSREYAVDEELVTTRSLAVLDVEGGHVVAVANGADGFALRTVGGEWKRIGFPGFAGYETPPDPATSGAPPEVDPVPVVGPSVLLAAGFLILTAGLVWLRRAGGGRRWWWLLTAPVITTAAFLFIAVAAAVTPSWELRALGWAAMTFAIAAVVVCGAVPFFAAASRVAKHSWIGYLAGALMLTSPILARMVQSLGWF